jgi:hypothetical protein
MLEAILEPWHESVEQPTKYQHEILERFVPDYAQTEYGRERGAGQVDSVASFRSAFPPATYDEYKADIRRVMEGDVGRLLAEDPVGWAITRGTTRGESKFIPMTPTDVAMRIAAGRAMMNFVASHERYDLFDGVNLNLNFPSTVGTLSVGGRELEYGYSSGIYARYVTSLTPLLSVPSQEEIDALGGGKTISAWEARFELAYQQCRSRNVTLVGGVAPTATRFARYMRRAHNCYPKDLWQPLVMTLGSIPGINTTEVPKLHAMYGRVAIREIYGATEGIIGQQRDELRAWVPNYDLYFLEVETWSGATKMLHEMLPGELGSLIISTPTLPRYRIGDVVLALRAPYFRCIGRERWWTPLKYAWGEIQTLNLGRL